MRSSQNHTKIQNTFSQRKKRIYKNVFTAFLVFACFVLSHCFVNKCSHQVRMYSNTRRTNSCCC
jgi:uncharacterized MAPEG superfamily protein